MAKIKVIQKEGDKFAVDGDKKTYKLKLLISGETINFLNVWRRTILEEVKTLAVEDVYIHENNSVLWDEFLAHRLGLIPLNTPDNLKSDEKVVLSLEAKGPGYVFAKDLKFNRSDVYTPYPDIPIVYLGEKHKVKLEAEAILGSGKKHAKWEPGHVFYYRTAELKVTGKLTSEEKKMIEELGAKVSKNKIEVPDDKKYDRTYIDAIQSVAKDKIQIVPKDEFVFYIESFGQMSAERIALEGLQEIRNKLRSLIELLIE